jgi:hypothetical protein
LINFLFASPVCFIKRLPSIMVFCLTKIVTLVHLGLFLPYASVSLAFYCCAVPIRDIGKIVLNTLHVMAGNRQEVAEANSAVLISS